MFHTSGGCGRVSAIFKALAGNQLGLAKRSSFMRANALECRREAHRCSELSETAATELGRQIYADLAKAWSWLAEGFEALRASPSAALPRKKAA